MTQSRDLGDDDVLLDVVRRALGEHGSVPPEKEAVPEAAVAMARAAFELRSLDEELAELTLDSLEDEPVLVRHDGRAGRLLSYATPQLTLDVELAADGRTLIGVISPAAAVPVEVEGTATSVTTSTDDLGRFRVELGRGWCRIRVRAPGTTMVTPVIVR